MTDAASTAIDAYGPMAQIVNSVPELQYLIKQAVDGQWTAAHFTAQVSASPWYQSHANSVRNLIMTADADPAEYQQQLANAQNLVRQTAQQLGRTVDINGLAYQFLANGWTQQSLTSVIGSQGGIAQGEAGAYLGNAAALQSHMKQVAASYGVPITNDYLNTMVGHIQSGLDSLDGFDQVIKQRAKSMFPQYAAQIDGGQTMLQVADPYMAQMAKTLELNQQSITLDNPYIQRALSVRDPQSGAVTSQSMWQFTQNLKSDPRYDHTTQAKTDAYAALAKVGHDFGFTGTAAGQ